MKFTAVRVLSIIFPLFTVTPALAGMQLYQGTLDAVTAPSKACEGVLGKHPATLVIIENTAQTGVSGYLESEGVAVGKLSGSDLAHLEISYPGVNGSGTTIFLTRSGTTLTGEMNGNGTTAVNHCTLDLGRLLLYPVMDEKAAPATLKRLAKQFEAQTTLYQAFSLTRNGSCEEALPLFEKSLGLADSVFGPGSPQLAHYIGGLANCYAKLGRITEFNALYEQRIGAISDESLKTVLTGLHVNQLIQEGRKLLAQADYEAALKILMQAYQLNPRNKDSIHLVMAVYVHSGRYSEAVAFLEQAAAKLEVTADRKEIDDIIALVYFRKALKDVKNDKETEAESSLRKAVALAPGSVQYLVVLARMRHKAGHFEEAEEMLSQGLERITDEPSRLEIMAVQEKLRRTEMIIKKLQ